MEKEVRVDGKTFEAKCLRCQSLLRFNRVTTDKQDTVAVLCGFLYPDCELLKEKKVKGNAVR